MLRKPESILQFLRISSHECSHPIIKESMSPSGLQRMSLQIRRTGIDAVADLEMKYPNLNPRSQMFDKVSGRK